MTNKRPALGKGLSALLEDAAAVLQRPSGNGDTAVIRPGNGKVAVAGTVVHIGMEQIETNPFQPRNEFEKQSLAELAQSIREYGLIQPITVRCVAPGKFQIISGERRFRAAQLAGMETVPAFVRLANDKAMLEMALVENVQREDLNPLEIAMGYKRLIEECNLTQEQLAKKVGQDRSTIANFLRLLKLPEAVQTALRDKKITMGHARALLSVSDAALQKKALARILNNELTVRNVEELARAVSQKKNRKPAPGARSKKNILMPLSFEDQKLQEDISALFKTPVTLEKYDDEKGRIIIYFHSQNEMQRIRTVLDV